MTAKSLTLQGHFLNSARRSKTPVMLFLLKGVKLQGIITWFDSFSLLLRRDGDSQLVYKHAVSTIMPARPLELDGLDQGEGRAKLALQDAFLIAAEREAGPVTMFLVNGVMLEGHVTRHDQFSLLLERGGAVQLVYKHAISTIEPDRPLSLENETITEEGGE